MRRAGARDSRSRNDAPKQIRAERVGCGTRSDGYTERVREHCLPAVRSGGLDYLFSQRVAAVCASQRERVR